MDHRDEVSPVRVQCPECGHRGRVVGCARFACPACGRIALTDACAVDVSLALNP